MEPRETERKTRKQKGRRARERRGGRAEAVHTAADSTEPQAARASRGRPMPPSWCRGVPEDTQSLCPATADVHQDSVGPAARPFCSFSNEQLFENGLFSCCNRKRRKTTFIKVPFYYTRSSSTMLSKGNGNQDQPRSASRQAQRQRSLTRDSALGPTQCRAHFSPKTFSGHSASG